MPATRRLVLPVLAVAALLGSASLLTSGPAAFAAEKEDGVQWRTDVAAATAEAEASGKPLFLDFTASWCPPCKQMEKDTWPDPRVQAMLNERFTPVKVDVDDDPKTAEAHRVRSIPTLIVFGEGEPADRVEGFQNADAMLGFLEPHAAEPAEAATR